MNLSTYRYGSERRPGEGLRIGTTRFLPRGVRRDDWQKKGYFDLWLPLLAPEPEQIKKFRTGETSFALFSRQYHKRMKEKECRQVIELLAGISLFLPLSLGCFCEDEPHCHRSLLKRLVCTAAKKKQDGFAPLKAKGGLPRYSSPVCFAEWE